MEKQDKKIRENNEAQEGTEEKKNTNQKKQDSIKKDSKQGWEINSKASYIKQQIIQNRF